MRHDHLETFQVKWIMTIIFKPVVSTGWPYDGDIMVSSEKRACVTTARENAPYYFHRSRHRWMRGNNQQPFFAAYNSNGAQAVRASGNPDALALYNRCYDKFKKNVYESVQIGADIAEGASTLSMLKTMKNRAASPFQRMGAAVGVIYRHSITLAASYRQVRRGNLKLAFNLLVKDTSRYKMTYGSVRRKQKLVTRETPQGLITDFERSAGALFLEMHFGWEPLVKDIFEALQVLSKDDPEGDVYATTSLTSKYSSLQWLSEPDNSYIMQSYTRRAVWRIGARVILNNPNRFFNEKFGLSNYLSIAWEAVPLSFLVDVFGNINKFLDSYTDFDGLTLVGGYHTWYAKTSNATMDWNQLIDPFLRRRCEYSNVAVCMDRKLGIPGPTLRFALPERLSLTRAATAVALVVTLFGNPPKK